MQLHPEFGPRFRGPADHVLVELHSSSKQVSARGSDQDSAQTAAAAYVAGDKSEVEQVVVLAARVHFLASQSEHNTQSHRGGQCKGEHKV